MIRYGQTLIHTRILSAAFVGCDWLHTALVTCSVHPIPILLDPEAVTCDAYLFMFPNFS